MSPVTISVEDLRKSRGVRGLASPLETATNFPDAWRGGVWRPTDIAEIEMTASFALLELASKFRPRYLRNFYELGKANLQAKANEPKAFVIYSNQSNAETVSRFLEILLAQGMEIQRLTREMEISVYEKNRNDFRKIPTGSFVVFTNQPQKNNVLSLFERQVYPSRLNEKGEAEVPYDVAGWTLPLQMGIETATAWEIKDFSNIQNAFQKVGNINQARQALNLAPNKEAFAKFPNPLKSNSKIGLYKGFTASIDEGWTRLVFDNFQVPYRSISNDDFRNNNLNFDTIILPSQSERDIVEGNKKGNYPEPFTGGITEKGVENLRKFVESGGTLICFDASCELVIKRFSLPVKNVLSGLKRNEFYNPGSVVRLEVDTKNPLAKNLKKETAAYFINSSAYEISDKSKIQSIAEYADKDALLSGYMLGEKYLNGKTALAKAEYGKGRVVLFGIRPQHRGQSFGTFPFIFNALEK